MHCAYCGFKFGFSVVQVKFECLIHTNKNISLKISKLTSILELHFSRGVIYSLNVQNFPKKLYFLLPDTGTHVCASGHKEC